MTGASDQDDGRSAFGRFAALSAIIFCAYVVCHGLTALVVAPIQGAFFEEVTVFASLLYLPHGIRVLSIWIWGWRAVPALIVSAYVCELIFTPAAAATITEPVLLFSILVGAFTALVGFELLRAAGLIDYAGGEGRPSWHELLLVGLVTSVLNSLGQSFVFSGQMLPHNWAPVFVVYAVGDVLGLCVVVMAMVLLRRMIRGAARG